MVRETDSNVQIYATENYGIAEMGRQPIIVKDCTPGLVMVDGSHPSASRGQNGGDFNGSKLLLLAISGHYGTE